MRQSWPSCDNQTKISLNVILAVPTCMWYARLVVPKRIRTERKRVMAGLGSKERSGYVLGRRGNKG